MTEVDDDIKYGMIEAISHLIHRDYEAIVKVGAEGARAVSNGKARLAYRREHRSSRRRAVVCSQEIRCMAAQLPAIVLSTRRFASSFTLSPFRLPTRRTS